MWTGKGGDAKDILHTGGCQGWLSGLCELGPLVRIEALQGISMYMQPQDCEEIVRAYGSGRGASERLFYREGRGLSVLDGRRTFLSLNLRTKVVLEEVWKIDANLLTSILQLADTRHWQGTGVRLPDDVIQEVTKSGPRGPWRHGFPAGRDSPRWQDRPEKIRYVVCNGDEGDPGAFMDGSVVEGDPYKMIEGYDHCCLCSLAQEGYIYVRAEYPLSVKRLRMAIEQAENYGFLEITSWEQELISIYILTEVQVPLYVVRDLHLQHLLKATGVCLM